MKIGMTQTFEAATAADLDVIRKLLSAGDLPVDDIGDHVTEFILSKAGRGNHRHRGRRICWRSSSVALAVCDPEPPQAIGSRLLSAIEARAAARGVRSTC